MIKIALIAGTAQGIGSGVHPESGFENTSKLFICVGNKDSGTVFSLTRKPLRPSLHSSRRVCDLHQETFFTAGTPMESGIPGMDQDSKTFHLSQRSLFASVTD
jgi:hypothetical protein